jgi:hypothetical protein
MKITACRKEISYQSPDVGGSSGGVIFSQIAHRIVRPVRHAHLLENELLQKVVRFFPSHPARMATIEAIVLMTDSRTARVISSGSQPK